MVEMNRTKPNKTEHKQAERPRAAGADPQAQADGGGLTDRQRRAVLAILESPTMEAAAKAAGVGKVTLYEWLKLPAFMDELRRARAELYAEGMGTIKAATAKAARRMIELLDSRHENTRRLTARDVLALGRGIVEAEDIDARLERIEDTLRAEAEAEKGRK